MDRVTDVVDSINVVFIEVLTYSFGLPLLRSSPPPGIPAACTSKSSLPAVSSDVFVANYLDNKFKIFLFTILLT